MEHGHKYLSILAAIVALALGSFSGCQSKPKSQHYALEGQVISVAGGGTSLTVKHGDIPGFMPAMTMSYAVADPKEADGLHPGDKITADLVVSNGKPQLEKIVVTEKAKPLSSAPGEAHP